MQQQAMEVVQSTNTHFRSAQGALLLHSTLSGAHSTPLSTHHPFTTSSVYYPTHRSTHHHPTHYSTSAVRHQNLQEPEELAAPVQEVGRGAPPEERQELGEPQEGAEAVVERGGGAEPEEDLAHGVEEGTDGEEPDLEEAAPVGGVEVEEQPGVFKTLFIFVVSFFTSLVPQRPPEFVGN